MLRYRMATIRSVLVIGLFAIVGVQSAQAQSDFVTPGPNTNIVGITPNLSYVPDFQLKQQQEPSCIVRPGNESYIMCAYNDLRASDLPAIQGDSWMGVSMSNDAGKTWFSRLSPGYLGHPNSIGMGFAADPALVAIPGNSPGLAVLNYIAAFRDSDAGVLAIQRWVEFPQEDQDFWKPEDDIYIVADGSEGRFIDKPTFFYLMDLPGQQGVINEQVFVEGEVDPISVSTPTGTLIAVYAVFTGNAGGSKLLMRKSTDNGKTWGGSEKISEEQNEVTGVSVTAVGQDFVVVYRLKGDNNNNDAIVSAFCSNDGNRKCSKGQEMFEICPFDQQATGSTFRTFSFPWTANDGERFWTFAADRRFGGDSSCTPVAGSPGLYAGKPRIVGMSSVDGKNWVGAAGDADTPFVVAPRPEGFQVMPTAFGTKGRIDVAWYDTYREEQAPGLPAGNNDLLINDYGDALVRVFRKADVYMTRLTASCGNSPNAGCTPIIETPVRVSQFPFVMEELSADVGQEIEAHLPNLRMYASGTLAFNGDYIALATPPFRKLANGAWIPNSLPGGAAGAELPGFTDRQDLFVAWGDNRDVEAEFTGSAAVTQLPYTPPLNSDANPGGPMVEVQESPVRPFIERPGSLVAVGEPDDDPLLPSDLYSCTPESFDYSRARDSNVYGSLIKDVPSLTAPTPTKPLGTIQRMFPLQLTNIDPDVPMDFCLHVVNQPADAPASGIASFYQLPAIGPFANGDQVDLLDVNVPAGSSASRAVFITTTDAASVITVNAYEGFCPATTTGSFGPLVNAVQFGDGPLLDSEFCSTNVCDAVIENETHDVVLASPALQAPVLQAPSFQAPSFQAPVLQAPVLQAPSFQAPSFQAPSFQAPVLQAPSFQAPSFQAPVLQAPSFQAPSLQAGTIIGDAAQEEISYQDVTYVLSTDANVTTTYSTDIAIDGLDPAESKVQLIAWTPNIYTTTDACFAVPQANQQIIAYTDLNSTDLQTVNLPTTFSPNNQNPYVGELSFIGTPDQDIAITVRMYTTGDSRQMLLDLESELQACRADENCDPDAQGLGAQRIISFGASSHGCSAEDAVTNTMNPNQPDCLNNGNEKILQDKQPPTFNVDPDITIEVEADLPDGAIVDLATGAVTASDQGEPIGVICYELDANGNILNVLPELLDIGSYPIRCEATDAVGNIGSVELTVDVTDSVDPVITLLGDLNPVVEAGDTYVDPGYTATDLRGTTVITLVAVVSGAVDTSTPGIYTLTYTVTDTGGNTVVTTRTVTVEDNTPPLLNGIPGDIAGVEATEIGGVIINWPAPTSSDIVDGSVPVVCVPASGSLFSVGSTLVNCSATDSSGNTSSASFNVTVVDTAPPVVSTSPDILGIQATSAAGATATWTTPSAIDAVDGVIVAMCLPSSGSVFAIGGPHVVICSATDSAGNTGSSTFNVSVIDSVAPIVATLPDQILEATGPAGAVAIWTNPAATDTVDGDLATSCVPASGATFALGGPIEVTCSAADSNGNTGTSAFSVTVQDTSAPNLSAANIDIPIVTNDISAEIDYVAGVTATDIVNGDLTPICYIVNPSDPNDMSDNVNPRLFEGYGNWTASCSATDSSGNSGMTTFTITLSFPYGINLDPPKKNARAGSTIPLDWQYLDLTSGNTIDSGFITPGISWIGPYASNDSSCSGTTDNSGDGNDSGSSGFRYSASSMNWQFSWQTPDIPGRYLLVISPPGETIDDASACVRIR